MNTKRFAVSLGALGCAVLLGACAFEANDEGETIDSTQEQILGGLVTTARPEIGQFIRNGGPKCTAELVAPNWALTAAHCVDFTTTLADDYFEMNPVGLVPPGTGGHCQTGAPAATNRKCFKVTRIHPLSRRLNEGLWNGTQADMALLRVSGAPVDAGFPIAIADGVPEGSTRSTKFGYGCIDRSTGATDGFKRFISFTATSSNNGCFGDSGGPNLFGEGTAAAPIWGVTVGFQWNPFNTWDTWADASYYKKQIEGVLHSVDGAHEFGLDRPGADYSHRSMTSASACSATCTLESRCRAFTWTNDNICHLKEATPNLQPLVSPGGGYTATSGLSSGTFSTLEVGYDRGGAILGVFDYTGSDSACIDACSNDYRCQAISIEQLTSSVKRCNMKSTAFNPTPNPRFKSVAKRGLEMLRSRVGSVISSFALGFHTPEFCQTECSRNASCQSWRYELGNGTANAMCFLQSDAPSSFVSVSTISGLKSRIYR